MGEEIMKREGRVREVGEGRKGMRIDGKEECEKGGKRKRELKRKRG